MVCLLRMMDTEAEDGALDPHMLVQQALRRLVYLPSPSGYGPAKVETVYPELVAEVRLESKYLESVTQPEVKV